MMTDTIADYLTRIRNAIKARHRIVEVPASNLKKEITRVLYEKGYILNYKFDDSTLQGTIKIALKYSLETKESAFNGYHLKRAYERFKEPFVFNAETDNLIEFLLKQNLDDYVS
jgi:ribosomal protein S8